MKVLVIQQKMIGDVLTSTIICESIKRQYPNCTTFFLVNSNTIPVTENNPYIDQIIEYKTTYRNNKIELLKFIKTLKKLEFDIVIDVYSKIESAFISYFTKAKIRIGYKKWYTQLLYTKVYTQNKIATTNAGLAIENRLKILETITDNTTNVNTPKIHLTETELDRAKQYLQRNHIDLNRPIYMISIIGSSKQKTYPNIYMSQIINQITLHNPKSQLLFNYIPNQKKEAENIYKLCSKQSKKQIHFDVFGKSLREFLAITKHCNSIIGNEGGAINMAKALNISTFAIYSPWILKEAWAMFEDGQQNISVHLNDYKPDIYQNTSLKELKPKWNTLYELFKPTYVYEKLKFFLEYNS